MENTQKEISSLFEKIKDVYQEEGSKHPFNIFSVLRVEHKEVILHSRFIAELLNPRGRHGKKKLFLHHFFETIGFDKRGEVTVTTEAHNIDILIEGQDWAIIIENKIYSGDGDKQIIRYYETIKKKKIYKNIYILYLCPFEKKPQKTSYEDNKHILTLAKNYPENAKILCISYKKHIRAWIEKCMLEEQLHTSELYVVFSQYREVLKKITGQIMSHQFIEEMTAYLKDKPQSFKYALAIPQVIEEIKERTKKAFWEELEDKLNKNDIITNEKVVSLFGNIGIYWEIDTRNKKHPIFFWVLMDGEGDDRCCIGFGFEYNESDKYPYPPEELLKKNPAMTCEDLALFQLEEKRNHWGWLAKYSLMGEGIDFNIFTSNRTIEMVEDTKRQSFIENVVKDIKTLIDSYVY